MLLFIFFYVSFLLYSSSHSFLLFNPCSSYVVFCWFNYCWGATRAGPMIHIHTCREDWPCHEPSPIQWIHNSSLSWDTPVERSIGFIHVFPSCPLDCNSLIASDCPIAPWSYDNPRPSLLKQSDTPAPPIPENNIFHQMGLNSVSAVKSSSSKELPVWTQREQRSMEWQNCCHPKWKLLPILIGSRSVDYADGCLRI